MKLIQILFYVILLMVFIPLVTIYLFDNNYNNNQKQLSNSLSLELQLTNRLIELSDRLKHTQMLSTNRKRDINSIKQDIKQLRDIIKLNIFNNNFKNLKHLNDTNIQQLFNSLQNTGNYLLILLFFILSKNYFVIGIHYFFITFFFE